MGWKQSGTIAALTSRDAGWNEADESQYKCAIVISSVFFGAPPSLRMKSWL